ncbi:hypothetical protein D3C71_221640 [compost metagenome]
MKKNLIALAVSMLAMAGLTRARTADVAFTYRMGAGFPGDVNRTHPASIVPGLMTPTLASKVRLYGDPVLIDTATNSYRGFLAADTAVTKIAGVLVRPYPTQQMTGGPNAAIGAAVPPDGPAVIDVINEGFVIARCNNFAAQQPTKGGAVFVWVTASTGAHVQGGFESVANGANTVAITNAQWNGPTDSDGITEMQVAAPLA